MTRARAKAGAALVAAGALLWLALPRPPIRATSYSREVYDRRHKLLRLTLSSDDKYRLWVPLDRISPDLVSAVLLQEDRWFRFHPGVNPASIGRAFWTTYLRGGQRRVGGSTITMQLARMVYRLDSRTPGGKLEQIARALQIELFYSKDRILEAYLNRVPYGGNVEGAGAASLVYFGKSSRRLGLEEALSLCVIPKSPARRSPLDGAPAMRARRELFARWVGRHPEDRRYRASMELPLTARTARDLPFGAPHFVEALLQDHPAEPRIVSTLDRDLQSILERQVRRYVEGKARVGIRNVSAMLVDHRNMEVLASLGSADYFDRAIQGQVNGTRARRSPGSALKPFIYGLALDQGLIHPWTLLKDAPAAFGGYNPENFDREFLGPVHAAEALVRSRNLPAVQLAHQLAPPGLYGFLRQAGVELPREESYYGLALVLGGAEVTMEDLVRLYAMLANGGVLRDLRPRRGEPGAAEGRRLLSPEASFMVLDMLKDNPRPARAWPASWSAKPLPVQWKTGTSFGFKDAWSVGVFGPYVLAVWLGNFDDTGNPALVGVEAAAPLMFDIISAIRAQQPWLEPVTPPGVSQLARVEVCSVSGQIPGPYCRAKTRTWFIPGKSPIRTCDIHREVLVDRRTGLRACGAAGAGARAEVFEFWPSDLQGIFKAAGIPRRLPPQDDPRCPMDARSARGLSPIITSPRAGVDYSLRAALAGSEKVGFAAITDADARELFWFVNDRFVGKARAGETLLWTAAPGSYVVRAVDDQGRSGARELRVAVVD